MPSAVIVQTVHIREASTEGQIFSLISESCDVGVRLKITTSLVTFEC